MFSLVEGTYCCATAQTLSKFTLYSSEEGLASQCRLYSKHSETVNIQEEEAAIAHTCQSFINTHTCTHHQHSHLSRGRLFPPSHPHPKRGRLCQFLVRLRHCSLAWLCPCQQYPFTQDFICSLQIYPRLSKGLTINYHGT